MADTNDRYQGSEHDLFDETAPRSIFAATWFRAVLVLIVLGVIGAVAVPYILDAMNAPKPGTTAKLPTPIPPPSKPAPPPVAVTPLPPPSAPPVPVTATPATSPTPETPPTAATSPSVVTPIPPITAAATPPPTPLTPTEKPTETKDAMVAATTPADTPKPEPKMKPGAAKTAVKAPKPGRLWFVQVGAFKDVDTAKKVATKLREENYTVEESLRGTRTATVAKATTAAPASGGDQYDVIITGPLSEETTKRLAAKGLTAEPVASGAMVKPSLPLRDAVALSKDLAVDGLKVQVRRAGGSAISTPKAASSAPASAGGDSLHRVSVGGFPDRATAVAALKELEAKGYKPFLTRR
jgi:cell division septation protein DedD